MFIDWYSLIPHAQGYLHILIFGHKFDNNTSKHIDGKVPSIYKPGNIYCFTQTQGHGHFLFYARFLPLMPIL